MPRTQLRDDQWERIKDLLPTSLHAKQNPSEPSLTTRGCPRPLPIKSAGKVCCACNYSTRTWPSRRRGLAPQAFSTLRNCRPDRPQKGLCTTPNQQTPAAVDRSGFESTDLFSHPRQHTVLRQTRKRTRTLGSEKPRKETQKRDTQQALRLNFPEYCARPPRDRVRSDRGNILGGLGHTGIQHRLHDRLGILLKILFP